MRLALIGAPAKYISTQAERVDVECGPSNFDMCDVRHGPTLGQDKPMVETTGGFTSAGLALEAQALVLPSLTQAQAVELGKIAFAIASARALPIIVEVRLGDWTVFKVALPGSKLENDSWVSRKARVVLATGNSTMHERVSAEERGVDWYLETGLSEELHAIHGGGLPLSVAGNGLAGILLISGLPQVEDHLLGVEIITEYLARQGENA
ncbi:unannotated protein [freshwater metagenome]|uniref:Unannotated protein n=1 Tax=freshwater metagenome TaxID=449393 RepID=A0A6J6WSC6_9ZZZZ